MFGSDPSIGSVGRSVFVEPLVSGVFLLDDSPPSWDFGSLTLSSPMDFVDSFLTCNLVTLPLSTLVDSVVSLMALSLSSTMGLVVDSVSARRFSACWSLIVCRISDSVK